ncbi:MAG: 6-pyruvoyl tetrahydropterin synthase family protein [Vicinamibacterales bacterium]
MGYSVTKRIEFCYGHRLLNYDGVCRHLHGHNAMVELDIAAETLDALNMVVDFSEVKRLVKSWIDQELDHKMILRNDDPLVPVLQAQGEPVVLIDSNPTAERLARLIYEQARAMGFNVTEVRFWETPSSCATYTRLR